MFVNELYFFIPEFFFVCMICFFIIIIVTWEYYYLNIYLYLTTTRFLSVYLLVLLLFLYSNSITLDFIGLNFFYISTYHIFFFKIFLLVICIGILTIFTRITLKWEFFAIFLISVLGLVLLVSSYDFLLFYLSLELYSLTLYILVTWNISSHFSTEAGLKYFILGSFSSGLLLLGLSLLYLSIGTLNFEDISILLYLRVEQTFQNNLIILAIIFIITAIFFKLGLAPFHMWTPDIYEGASLYVTAIIAIIPKLILVSILYRIVLTLFSSYIDIWLILMIICSIMSFIFGSIGAIYQVKVTRLLAYSAINNAGFFILALCTQSFFGYTGGILYVVTYTIIMFGLFIFFLSIKPFGKPITLIYIHSFINLNNSLLAFSGSLLLLSLAGIPPLLGFFSKFIIFFALFDKNLFLLGFLSMLFTIFTSFYYLRLVKIFLFDSSIPIYLLPISKLSSLILGFVTIINLIFFIFPDYLLIIINNLALGLYI